MLYEFKDVDDTVHFIFIVAENVKESINGTTRFVNYTDNDGMNGVVFGSDTYNLANFTNDNVDMHVGIDCTTAESFIIDSDLFNSLEKEVVRFKSITKPEIVDNILKNIPHLYLKDGSESKELLDMIDRFLLCVREYFVSDAPEVYLDDSQNKVIGGWLYKDCYEVTCLSIVDKDTDLRVTDWTTHGNPIVRTTGNAVGLTETGLIKIKCTSNGYDYIYVR